MSETAEVENEKQKWAERGEWDDGRVSRAKKSEDERRANQGESDERKLQLFFQLLSSGCVFTGVCVCALCP